MRLMIDECVYLCMFVCRMMMVRDELMDGWMEYCIRFLSTYSCCWVHVYFLHVVVSRVLVRVGGGNVVQDGIQLNARYGK